jgi:hypothetical protein
MLENLVQTHAGSLSEASTEAQFWDGFQSLCEDVGAFAGGLAVLWTPPVAMASFVGRGAEQRLEEILAADDGLLYARRAISVPRLGDIRRSVRGGLYVASARDTQRRWHVVLDARELRRSFTEPMVPGRELGLC